ncbi:MAG: hypothetical protein KA035_03055 [Candidatus Levybacteria bacterium]|nr:hypothetical protein [Candidatus Levybacteria bacterium]
MIEAQQNRSQNHLFVINPTAGSGLSFDKNREILRIARSFPSSDVVYTKAPQHATEIAHRALEQDVEVIVAAGGDGTVNDVIQATADTPLKVGILATGFFNVFAREVGIPKNLEKASEIILEGKTEQIDLGEVNGTFFLLAADFGMDADKYLRFHKPGMARKHSGAYTFAQTFAWAALTGLGYFGHNLQISHDGETTNRNVLLGAITNTTDYGKLPLNRNTVLNDGRLELTYFTGKWAPQIFPQFAGALVGLNNTPGLVRDTLQGEITMKTELNDSIGLTLDGNPMGYVDTIHAKVHPLAQRMIIPSHTPRKLFRDQIS